MRKRIPRRNSADMTYDPTIRSLNFVTDLLADKMDVIRRKAEMYADSGYVEASEAMRDVWSKLNSAYESAKDDIRLISNELGKPIEWGGSSQVQQAMDIAYEAMTRYGLATLERIRQERANAEMRISSLKSQALSLQQEMESLKRDYNISSAEKIQTISTLQAQVTTLKKSIANAENTIFACESKTRTIQAEALMREKVLVGKIQTLEQTIRSLNTQIDESKKSAELDLSSQRSIIADLTLKLDNAKTSLTSLIREKNACMEQIASLKRISSSEAENLNSEIASYKREIQELYAQIDTLKGSNLRDEDLLSSLEQKLAATQDEVARLTTAKAECESRVSELSEPLQIDRSEIRAEDVAEHERALAEIAKRDKIINDLLSEKENAQEAAKNQAANNKRTKSIAIGLGVVAAVATGVAIYKSRPIK